MDAEADASANEAFLVDNLAWAATTGAKVMNFASAFFIICAKTPALKKVLVQELKNLL